MRGALPSIALSTLLSSAMLLPVSLVVSDDFFPLILLANGLGAGGRLRARRGASGAKAAQEHGLVVHGKLLLT